MSGVETAPPPVDEISGQAAMLDLNGELYNAMWVDSKQPLFIPDKPLHWKAHKLQVLLARLDKQAEQKPSAFSSANYIVALNEYTKCINQIKLGANDGEQLDEGGVDQFPAGRKEEAAMGAGVAPGVDPGISADNPLTR